MAGNKMIDRYTREQVDWAIDRIVLYTALLALEPPSQYNLLSIQPMLLDPSPPAIHFSFGANTKFCPHICTLSQANPFKHSNPAGLNFFEIWRKESKFKLLFYNFWVIFIYVNHNSNIIFVLP